ncbi:MAG: PAS domain S-box protein [Rhodocyclaceae bacterium]|nr:PAS domain S-box protein [Rhodocyclaceae bacterium]
MIATLVCAILPLAGSAGAAVDAPALVVQPGAAGAAGQAVPAVPAATATGRGGAHPDCVDPPAAPAAMWLGGLLGAAALAIAFFVGRAFRRLRTRLSALQQQVAAARPYEFAARCACDAIWEYDLATRRFVLTPQRASPAILALTPASLHKTLRRVRGEHRRRLFEALAALSPAQPEFTLDLQLAAAASGPVWACVRGLARFDAAGRMTALGGALSDVGAERLAGVQATQYQAFLSHLIDELPLALAVRDASGQVVLANRAHTELQAVVAAHMVGGEPEGAGGTHLNLDDPAADRAVIETDKPAESEVEFQGEAARCLTFLVRKVPVRDGSGAPSVLTLLLNISELRDQSRRVQRYQNFLERLFEALPHPAWVKDADSRFRMVNRAFCAMLRAPPEAVLGRSTADLFAAQEAGQYLVQERLALGLGSHNVEHLFTDARGGRRRVLTHIVACEDAEGEPVLLGLITDLSVLRATEAELRASLEKLSLLFQHARHGLFLCTMEGDFIDANPYCRELLGHTIEQLRRRSLRSIGVDALPLGSDPFARDAPVSWECELQGRGGKCIPVLLALHPVSGSDGTPYLWGIFEDLTERRRATTALAESEARYRALVEQTSVVVWEMDAASDTCTYVSPQAELLLGFPLASWSVPGFWRAHIFPEDLEAAQNYRAQAATDSDFRAEYRMRRADGNVIWVEDVVRVHRDGGGNAVRLSGIFMDVTERKRTEQALATSERQLRRMRDEILAERQVFMAGPTVALRWRAESGWPVDYVSPNAETVLGYAAGEFVSGRLRFGELVSAAARAEFGRLLRSMRTSQLPYFETEFGFRHGNGHALWVYLYAIALREKDGRATAFHGYVLDITDRKRAEAELQRHRDSLQEIVDARTTELLRASNDAELARARAEQASQAKSTFLANMSHELRTPMHAVLSYAKLGEARVEQLPSAKLREYFQRINQSGARLLHLLNDLLDLSKLEAGKMLMNRSQCDIVALARATLREFESLATQRQLALLISCDRPVLELPADPQRLAQVLSNLLSNAVKFSAPGGTVDLSITANDQVVTIAVSDEGVGIPEGELDSVFDKFVQSSKTRSSAGGTGLGLAICREIVQGHRGRILARNRPSGGAQFIVELPRDGGAEWP